MRVLFVSDVYFPRVNGVSTSIRTFPRRSGAARRGIHAGRAGLSRRRATMRTRRSSACPRAACRATRKIGAFSAVRCRRVSNANSPRKVDLVHIHTPFIAHYAGGEFAREHGLPVVATYHTFFEDYLHHYVPILPRGIGRWIARRFTLSQCDDVAALISPSAPMRDALLGLWRHHAHRSAAHGSARRELRAR